jgi:hypothetical protein
MIRLVRFAVAFAAVVLTLVGIGVFAARALWPTAIGHSDSNLIFDADYVQDSDWAQGSAA